VQHTHLQMILSRIKSISTPIQNKKNDCDTDASGTSSEGCLASDKTTTDTINVQGEKNKVDLDFDAKQKNDCEGEASATNSVVCKTLVDRDIGEINIFP